MRFSSLQDTLLIHNQNVGEILTLAKQCVLLSDIILSFTDSPLH